MLASFPGEALLLFGVLFVMGIGFGWLADVASRLLGFRYGEGCKVDVLHREEECRCFDGALIWRQLKGISAERGILVLALAGAIVAGGSGVLEEGWEGKTIIILAAIAAAVVGTAPDHYLRTHIVGHIVKKHLWKLVLWTFFALVVVGIAQKYCHLESFGREYTTLVIVMAGLVGLVPQSGPHLIFVTMYAKGMVPFSVLLTSSIVQDGHALLPLLSASVRDALTIKGMKLFLGLAIGFILHALGG